MRSEGKHSHYLSHSVYPPTHAKYPPPIEAADFLTPEQKRDIFYNNAARFVRLTEDEIAAHHGN